MPFIDFKTNIMIPEEKEILLKSAFGKDISIIPGKSENWLMVEIEEKVHLYFKGDSSLPTAFVSVSVCTSKPDSAAYDKLTSALCKDISSVLGISQDRIYIRYSEHPDWGWNGGNF